MTADVIPLPGAAMRKVRKRPARETLPATLVQWTDETSSAAARMDWHDLLATDFTLSCAARAVAGFLVHRFNSLTGETFISAETIAEEMGISAPHVRRALENLIGRGWLVRSRRSANSSNTHRPAFNRLIADSLVALRESRAAVRAEHRSRHLIAGDQTRSHRVLSGDQTSENEREAQSAANGVRLLTDDQSDCSPMITDSDRRRSLNPVIESWRVNPERVTEKDSRDEDTGAREVKRRDLLARIASLDSDAAEISAAIATGLLTESEVAEAMVAS